MFRFEELPERWIASCTDYLKSLFKESLRGKTVIDYAFGRGNWSLAFLAAGAHKVIAVDAAKDAVDRFKAYCRRRNVTNIEVVLGNILEQDVTARGDLIWLYGILPNIEDQTVFLNRVKAMASGPETRIYVFYYNAKSLREFTVQACRGIKVYTREKEFQKASYMFVRPARLRARDDLTAPYVAFVTAREVKTLLRSCGIYINRQDPDFQEFLRGKATEDFYPHQFLCSLKAQDEVEIHERKIPYAREVEILKKIAEQISLLTLGMPEKRSVAIGLYNTHFAFLRSDGNAYDSAIELFLFLMHVLLQKEVMDSTLSPCIGSYYRLFRAAIAGADRAARLRLLQESPVKVEDNSFTEYLLEQNVRS